jgi:hypothetical protein
MKQLIAGVVIILVIGVAGFFYRNVTEHAVQPLATTTGSIACTSDAKVCPDGASVGRTGPSCAFPACPPPNVEVPEANIAFVLPFGYVQTEAGTSTQETLRIYEKEGIASGTPQVIDIKHYAIPAGKSADDAILANAVHATSGKPAKAMTEFTIEVIGGKSFYVFQTERFEGTVETAYFLPRANDVLRFDVVERNVTNWSDSKLNISALPEHAVLETMLATLQTS